MNSNTVLFVDDEENIRLGLQRMLRSMRKEWDMAFVGSAQEALALLERQHVDVVVSDMRMPGMDGAQLLNEVQSRHPDVIRIILSGHADREMIMRSLGASHQYLSKPCDAETLKAAVGRAMGLRSLFREEPSLMPLISRLHTLPSLPSLYLAIVEELKSPNATLKKVGQIIASDPAMTVKMLQLVNSAFFGIGRQITSPVHAVNLLGLDLIQALVLSAQVFGELDTGIAGVDPEALWRHSTAVGTLAKRIAKAEGEDEQTCNDCMVAGLLHDIGKLVLLANLPAEYTRLIELARREKADLFELERLEFGANHAELGGYLLGLWGLPDIIVEAVAFHHHPAAYPLPIFSPRVAVYAADALVHEDFGNGAADGDRLDPDHLRVFADTLPVWQALYRELMEQGTPA